VVTAKTTARSEMKSGNIPLSACLAVIDKHVAGSRGHRMATAMWHIEITYSGCCGHFLSPSNARTSEPRLLFQGVVPQCADLAGFLEKIRLHDQIHQVYLHIY